MGRTQAEKRYILDTVLDHMPIVSGSERDMEVYVIQKRGYNGYLSCDEFGETTNNLRDSYGQRSRKRGSLHTQEEYILAVAGSLRDRLFKETYIDFQNWLCRLAKRVEVIEVLVEIKAYERQAIIRNTGGVYSKMFEVPSWYRGGQHSNQRLNEKLKAYHSDADDFKEPNWCEYLMWEGMSNCMYPRLLGYKYFNDAENDTRVESWLRKKRE